MVGTVKAVREAGMPYHEAARNFNVLVETLRRRVIGTVEMDARQGPSTILTREEEDLE